MIEAAAGVLYRTGFELGWFPKGSPPYEELDSIAKSEFDGIVEQMLRAAKKARETL